MSGDVYLTISDVEYRGDDCFVATASRDKVVEPAYEGTYALQIHRGERFIVKRHFAGIRFSIIGVLIADEWRLVKPTYVKGHVEWIVDERDLIDIRPRPKIGGDE